MSNKEQKKKLNINEINNFLNNFSIKKVSTEDSDDDEPTPYVKPLQTKPVTETSTQNYSTKPNISSTSTSKAPNASQQHSINTYTNPNVFVPPTLSKSKPSENTIKKETISNPFAQYNLSRKNENETNNTQKEEKEVKTDSNLTGSTNTNTFFPSMSTSQIVQSVNNDLNQISATMICDDKPKNNFFDEDVKPVNTFFEESNSTNIQTNNTRPLDNEVKNNFFHVDNNDSSKDIFKETCSIEGNLNLSHNIYKKPETKCLSHTIQKKHDVVFSKVPLENYSSIPIVKEAEKLIEEKRRNELNFGNIYNEFQNPLNDQILSSFDNIIDSQLNEDKLETINLNADEQTFNEVTPKENNTFNTHEKTQIESKPNFSHKKAFQKNAFPGHFSQNKFIHFSNKNKVILRNYDALLNTKNSLEGFFDNNYFPLNYGEGR
jgi:hypothetical protein